MLPGVVVPGVVLGGFDDVPGCAWEVDGLAADGFGVVPGVVAEPLLVGVQGGMLLGGLVPGVAAPGVVVVEPCGFVVELGVAPGEGVAVPEPGVAVRGAEFVVPGVDGVPAGVFGVACVLGVPV